jgi:hypothetical protein
MAQNKRLEMMKNTFGRQLAADLAMADFFEACFARKSEKVLDRLAKIAASYLPADMQAECKEHRDNGKKNATKKNEAAKKVSKEFSDDDMLRAMGIRVDAGLSSFPLR